MDNYRTHHPDRLHPCRVGSHSIFWDNCRDDLEFLEIRDLQCTRQRSIDSNPPTTYRHYQCHHHKRHRAHLCPCPFDQHSVRTDSYRTRLPVYRHRHAQNQLGQDYTPIDNCQDHSIFRHYQRPDLNVDIER